MTFFKLSLLILFIASSCSFQKENTFEENLSQCRKESMNGDNTNYPTDCMKGSLGPVFTTMTNRGDSISTKPKLGRAMILYFWSATTKFAPPDFVRSDAEDAAAMNELYHTFYKQVDFIGFPFNDSITVNKHLKSHFLPFPQSVSEKNAEIIYHITQHTTPLVIFINPDGRVVDIIAGSPCKKNLTIERYTPIIQACLQN